MSRGRPRLPDGEQLVHVSLRLPRDLVDWYDATAVNSRSELMRAVLEYYKRKKEEEQ